MNLRYLTKMRLSVSEAQTIEPGERAEHATCKVNTNLEPTTHTLYNL